MQNKKPLTPFWAPELPSLFKSHIKNTLESSLAFNTSRRWDLMPRKNKKTAKEIAVPNSDYTWSICFDLNLNFI